MKKKVTRLFFICLFTSQFVNAQSPSLVISQVYSTSFAGAAPITYRACYIELFNRSNSAVNIAGYSLQFRSQYNSPPGYFHWYSYPLPSAVINPGQYYL